MSPEPAPISATPRQITPQTAVSVGLVVVLVGGTLGLFREVYGVRAEISPQLATIGARVEAMAESLAEVRRRLDAAPSSDSISVRLQAIEARVARLEGESRK